MPKLGRLMIGLLLSSGCGLYAEVKSDPDKLRDIRILLEVTGSEKLAMQMIEQMVTNFKQQAGDIPTEFWERFLKDIDPKQFTELVVPAYDKHLTHDDIKGLIEFYRSPAGQRFVAAQPQIVQQTMTAGQEWGRNLAEKIIKSIEAERKRSSTTGAEVP